MTTPRLPCPAYAAITMIKGNVGITRNTSVTNDKLSSAKPPRYAADTPTITESIVESAPTTKAMTSVSRVP